jgi:hypothetical protein
MVDHPAMNPGDRIPHLEEPEINRILNGDRNPVEEPW